MAISVAQRNAGSDAAGGTVSTTFASNTLNNCIIAIVTSDGADTTIGTPTDTPGNTYSVAQIITSAGGFSMRCFVVYQCKTSASTNTVSVNDNFHDACLFIFEVSGLATSSAYDKHSSNNQASATALTSNATPTRTNPNELLIGITANTDSGTLTPTLGAGFSNLQHTNVAFNNSASEEQIVSSTGTTAATFTLAANSDTTNTAIFTFSDTAIGGGASGESTRTLTGFGI